MAFKAFNSSNSRKEQLPWANELVLSNAELVGKIWDVTCIKLKQKGLIVECTSFAGWFFKSSEQYKFLVTYLESWVESKQKSPVLQMQLVKQEPFFVLGEDDEKYTMVPWVLEENGVFYQTVAKSERTKALNLSLPTVPSSSELRAREELDELADRRANEHRQQKGKKEPPEEPPTPAIARK